MTAPIVHHMFFDTEAKPPDMTLWDGLALDYKDNEPGFQWRNLAKKPQRAAPVCVAWALDDGPVSSSMDPLDFARDLFRARQWAKAEGSKLLLVAFNIKYDLTLTWLWLCGVNDAAARMFSGYLPGVGPGETTKPWNLDVKECQPVPYIGMEDLCARLGIKSKASGIHGGDVMRLVWSGQITEALRYCEGDVRDLRALFLRLCATHVGFNLPAWAQRPAADDEVTQ